MTYIQWRHDIGLFEAIASCLKWVASFINIKYIYNRKTSTQKFYGKY